MSRSSKRKATENDHGILMILSPAKTLDLSPMASRRRSDALAVAATATTTMPQCNAAKTLEIAKIMKSHNKDDLVKRLGVSAKIGKTAQEYWKTFQLDNVKDEKNDQSKPCIYAFTGVAYQGLQIKECSEDSILYLQENLRIIDPLYGVLRPLDEIQPYRLEMATKGVFVNNKKLKLADFWKESVTTTLASDLRNRQPKIVLNIASDEYSTAVDTAGLPSGTQFLKVVFLDGGRVVAVHAKRARGLMAKFVAQNKCRTIDQIKEFDLEGYAFSASQSDESSCLVFERRNKPSSSSGGATTTQKRKTPSNRGGTGAKKQKWSSFVAARE